ncbi:hypothetical protein HNY73_013435 [Argiope bruennichi]|uniref:Uncharacterized protein n=1 Tax=Argiope bruennichi TaxID=94029 RepID=A0A8T0F005_ARGBR|nr:hypothetical protein HNY73_013435 [Argiope bruennichi]
MAAIAGSHEHGDEGEYGKHNEWREVMCEKADDNLYKDMDACFQSESQLVRDAFTGCAAKALPESNGSGTEFMNAACKDKSLFVKLDECFEEHEADEEFKRREEITPDVKACYVEVLKKYDLNDLLHYLEEE